MHTKNWPLSLFGAVVLVIVTSSCQGGTASTTATTAIFEPGLPMAQFITSHFASSNACSICHSSLKDASGHDVSIDSQWRSTMMANAAKDPYFLAAVASQVNQFGSLSSTIQSECALCHMPTATTQATAAGTAVSILDTGLLNTANSLNKAAMDGVSCSLCHQIQAGNLGQPGSFSGNYQVDTSATSPSRPEFGPYPNPLVGPMQTVVGFTPTQGAQASSSALCATCHTLYTPVINSQGNIAGTFPEQVTYLEWLNSTYGNNPSQQLTCQSCHMPAAGGAGAISNNPATIDPRSPFYQHLFVGGNTLMLSMMGNNVNSLGISASSSQMQATEQLTASELAAAAKISIASSAISNNSLNVTLSVVNLSGHKFPTAFPSRRAWIEFTVTDSTGKVIFESGKPNADGSISGNVADTSSSDYAPHYDVITSPSQVEIYEAIMGASSGKVTYSLLSAADYLKDNRLLPSGFNKATASADTAVVGSALNDPNFVGGSDQVTYQVSLSGKGPYTVSARLLYEAVSPQFSKNLQGSNALISSFTGELKTTDKTPELVSSATITTATTSTTVTAIGITGTPPPPSSTALLTLPDVGIAITTHNAAAMSAYKGLCLVCHASGGSNAQPTAPTWNGKASGSIHNLGIYSVPASSKSDHTGYTAATDCLQTGCHAAPTS